MHNSSSIFFYPIKLSLKHIDNDVAYVTVGLVVYLKYFIHFVAYLDFPSFDLIYL